jgi:hypothetical protein
MRYSLQAQIFALVVVLELFILGAPLLAQVQLTKSTKAAHEVFLEGYARTDNKCESIDPPTVYVDKPPKHGIVCSKNADLLLRKTVENDLSHCLRRKAHGIHVIYVPSKGYAGPDTVRYTVRFPTTQHTVDVILTVLPDAPEPGKSTPADTGAMGLVSQMPGPLPVCAALVSWKAPFHLWRLPTVARPA